MAMNMRRAFNGRMKTKMTHYSVKDGSYDDNNDWQPGTNKAAYVFGVITSGNKFSQFEEGEAIRNLESGIRKSNYRQLWVEDKYGIDINDKIGFRGRFFNILQHTDESVFGFQGFLIEEAEDWKP